MTTELFELAQPLCDDPVIAAAHFKPNASGSRELASLVAMSERQLLKANGSYFAERVLLAVTTVEIVAIDRGVTGVIREHRLTWRRDGLVVRRVPLRSAAVGNLPAFELASNAGFPRIELAPVVDDDSTRDVVDLVLVGRLHSPGCRRQPH